MTCLGFILRFYPVTSSYRGVYMVAGSDNIVIRKLRNTMTALHYVIFIWGRISKRRECNVLHNCPGLFEVTGTNKRDSLSGGNHSAAGDKELLGARPVTCCCSLWPAAEVRSWILSSFSCYLKCTWQCFMHNLPLNFWQTKTKLFHGNWEGYH